MLRGLFRFFIVAVVAHATLASSPIVSQGQHQRTSHYSPAQLTFHCSGALHSSAALHPPVRSSVERLLDDEEKGD